MKSRLFIGIASAAALAACGASPAPGNGPPPPTDEPAAVTMSTGQGLGGAIRDALADDSEARYFDAEIDLNGDGKAEAVTYVAGPMVCGTGGCPVFVFTPRDGNYELVSSISVARVPIRVSSGSTNGWRDLIVEIGGGGAQPAHTVLRFDGRSYPSNPTVPPAEAVSGLDGTSILIGEFGSYTDGKALPGAAIPE